MTKARFGTNHVNYAAALGRLASVYLEQASYGEAESLNKRALMIREEMLGKDHPDVGEAFNNLALGYQKQGRHAEAEAYFKHALAIFEKKLGKSHAAVALALGNLGMLYNVQGRYAEAVAYGVAHLRWTRTERTTAKLRPISTTWRTRTRTRASTQRRRRISSVRWLSGRRSLARITRTSR